MDRHAHRITVCTSCRAPGEATRPGPGLIDRLRTALAVDGAPFEVSGAACMAGCDRPCTVSYQAPGKATYLFGDVDAEDLSDLAVFARQYHALADGWCSATTRPGKLRHATLARVPALIAVAEPAG